MNQSRAWMTWCFGGCLLAWSGCACFSGWGGSSAPDLSQAGGSRLEMAAMSERLGRADLAEKFYRDVLAQQPGNQVAHHRLGALAAHDGRWRDADEHFSLALRAGPPSADLLTDIAYAHYERHQMRAAEQTLREALELEPEHAKSRSLLALVLGEQGRFREGLAEFRQAVHGLEDRGGAGEAYGTSIAAGAAPAPPESTRRTQVQLAAAGVRGTPSADPSSRGVAEGAEERSIVEAAAPPTVAPPAGNPLRVTSRPAASPAPVIGAGVSVASVGSLANQPRLGSPTSIQQDHLVASREEVVGAPIVASSATNRPPRPLPVSSLPVRLPPPPQLAEQRRSGDQAPKEQSVVVRVDPSGAAAHLPGVAPAGGAKELPTAGGENHRCIRSVEPPPPSKVFLREIKKDDPAIAAGTTKATETASKASPVDRSALAARPKNADTKNARPKDAASAGGDMHQAASAASAKPTKIAADPAIPAAPSGPSLTAPPTAEAAAQAKMPDADQRPSRRAASTARPDYSDAKTPAAPLAHKTGQRTPARETAAQDATPSRPEKSAGLPVDRSAAHARPAGSPISTSATGTKPTTTSASPDDCGVLSRSKSHSATQRTGISAVNADAVNAAADKAKPAAPSASNDATRSAGGPQLARKTKLASYEEPAAAPAIDKSAPQPKPQPTSDLKPPAPQAPSAAKTAHPVPVTPSMSLPVGLEFSFSKGNGLLPGAK